MKRFLLNTWILKSALLIHTFREYIVQDRFTKSMAPFTVSTQSQRKTTTFSSAKTKQDPRQRESGMISTSAIRRDLMLSEPEWIVTHGLMPWNTLRSWRLASNITSLKSMSVICKVRMDNRFLDSKIRCSSART